MYSWLIILKLADAVPAMVIFLNIVYEGFLGYGKKGSKINIF